jgi:hypothetical protein
VDDFMFFAASEAEALQDRHRLDRLLVRLSLLRHPTNALCEPTPFGHNMGINIDSATCYYFAPADKLRKINTQARHFIGHATRKSR